MSAARRLAIALLLGGAALAPARGADVVAVVSPKIAVTSLSANELADIYLGRSNRFPGGAPATPCDLPEDSPLREAFYAQVVGKTLAQMKAYWSKLIFTGRGQPPREVASSQEAKKAVIDNPGVVCYIDRALADPSVTVLMVR
jgi:ABC-type phosphate transport system substrate-binding protein